MSARVLGPQKEPGTEMSDVRFSSPSLFIHLLPTILSILPLRGRLLIGSYDTIIGRWWSLASLKTS